MYIYIYVQSLILPIGLALPPCAQPIYAPPAALPVRLGALRKKGRLKFVLGIWGFLKPVDY